MVSGNQQYPHPNGVRGGPEPFSGCDFIGFDIQEYAQKNVRALLANLLARLRRALEIGHLKLSLDISSDSL
jgi:hypothetical protein